MSTLPFFLPKEACAPIIKQTIMSNPLVTRALQVPDPLRTGRYRRAPEFGPRVLFFSGGTALNEISRMLKNYTHNSVHMVTPFDSGGSSAKLRKAFDMPSIGDLRSRLMALADEMATGHPEIYQLFCYRLPEDAPKAVLAARLNNIARGRDPLVDDIPNPMRRLIRSQLAHFQEAMPDRFDLGGASIGNLILAGGYLANHEHLDPIIYLFSKLINVRGTVCAVANTPLHLGADLEDGSRVIGQHLLTGKEATPIRSPISRVFLSQRPGRMKPGTAKLRNRKRKLISDADLICYPPGSFYTSLMANLLTRGVGAAIAENDCPKVYIPNLGVDPEQLGLDAEKAVTTLLGYLREDCGDVPCDRLLNFILIDSKHGGPMAAVSKTFAQGLGIRLIKTKLVSSASAPYYDPELLVAALLSLT
jgi:CofD-related protein of GAK system